MFITLVQKELKSILLSPKFTATFAVCSLLMLLSTYIGINEYRSSVTQFETAQQLVLQEMRTQTGWTGMSNRIFRKPDPMQIFVTGITNDIGRWSSIDNFNSIKLLHSSYSDDPIFAVFRFIDFSFIVQIVLSLLALLFTYDAINGERESGTLKLVFSNAIPRVHYTVAKFVGSWLGLVIPLTIPTAMCALLLLLYKVPFTAAHWGAFGALLGASLLYFTFFIALGLFVSAITRNSNVSFLVSFVVWIIAVLIIPRAGVIAAGNIIHVPSVAEIEGQHDTYAKDKWEQLNEESQKLFETRRSAVAGMNEEEKKKYEDDHMWGEMLLQDSLRKNTEKEINDYAVKLNEDLRNKKMEQENLGFALSRFSPASAYQLAVMKLARTDIGLKSLYEDLLNTYRGMFTGYIEKKQKQSGQQDGIRITMDTERGFSFSAPREQATLDITDMPQFEYPTRQAAFPWADMGILLFCSMLAFTGAFIGFLKYDVR